MTGMLPRYTVWETQGRSSNCRADLLPKCITDPLSRLFDDLSCSPDPGALAASFRRSFGLNLGECFLDWAIRPIASGSAASVIERALGMVRLLPVKVLRPLSAS
jgi:predicted unusual protein kinase regulating ubiquinone biosynthesis (AarF/ABC1/UbiB family)